MRVSVGVRVGVRVRVRVGVRESESERLVCWWRPGRVEARSAALIFARSSDGSRPSREQELTVAEDREP